MPMCRVPFRGGLCRWGPSDRRARWARRRKSTTTGPLWSSISLTALGTSDFVVAADAADAAGFGQLGEVGVLHGGLAVALLVEEILPLLDHALEVVVEDGDFDRDVVFGGGGEFVHGHEEAGVAVDVDDDFAGAAELGADGAGEAVAHGAQAAAGDHLAGIAPAVELGGPHLMLADAGGDDGFAVGLAVDFFDHVLRLGDLGVVEIVEGISLLPGVDLGPPCVCGRGAR